MALSRVKTWVSGEVLTSSDLNAEFNNLLSNATSLISPMTGALDMNGLELIMDADADTSLTADTDDQLDVKLGGTDQFRFKTVASAVNGIDFFGAATGTEVYLQAFGSDSDIDIGIIPKGTGIVRFPSSILFEGTTADGFETTLAVTDPTADRTITIPNETGTVMLLGTTQTVSGTLTVSGNNTHSGNNTFSGTNTFSNSVSVTTTGASNTVSVTSTEAGAAVWPAIVVDRNSATPAASDILSSADFNGRDSGGGTDTYARIQAEIVDHTAASEDGKLALHTAVAGTLAARAYVAQGLVVGSAAGGDKGVGTINVDDLYIDGVLSSPGLSKLNSDSVSSAATLDITMTSYTSYRHKMIIATLLPATTDVHLYGRVSTDGGSTFSAGATDYNWCGNGIDDAGAICSEADNADSEIQLSVQSATTLQKIANNAGYGISITILLYDTTGTSLRPRIEFSGRYLENSASRLVTFDGSGFRLTAQDTDAFRLLFSSGNISSGNWALYGFN